MLFFDDRFLILNTRNNVSADMLTDEFICGTPGIPGHCYLDILPDTQVILPVLEKSLMMKKIPLPGFFKFALNKNNPQHHMMLKQNLQKVIPDISDDIITRLLEIHEAVQQKNPISKNLIYMARGNAAVIDALSLRMQTTGFVPEGANRTLSQRKFDDKIFIKIPSDTQINSFIESSQDEYSEAPIPNLSDIFNPYPSPVYSFTKIKEILESSPAVRPSIIIKWVEAFKREYPSLSKGSQFYADNFEEIPSEYVFGDSINTNLPIQENEKEYYETLLAFIKHHIYIHNKSLHKDFDEDKLREQTESDFNTGKLPTGVRLYLENLLNMIIASQYFHTGVFSKMYDLFKDDDEADNHVDEEEKEKDDDDGMTAKKRYFRDTQDSRLIQSDADVVLQEYLQISAVTHGCSVYAEAIIKLLRWGPRKHSMLIVGENNPNMFDLVRMLQIDAQFDFSKFKPIEEEDRRTFYVHGYVKLPVNRLGLNYETVAILLMYQNFDVPNIGVRSELYCISVPDFISEFKKNNRVIGVNYTGSHFVVDSDLDELTQRTESDVLKKHEFIQTAATMDTLINCNVRGAKSPAYAILCKDPSIILNVDINRPLTDILMEASDDVRVMALNGYWVKHFEQNCPLVDSNSLQEILNAYQNTVAVPVPDASETADFAYNIMFGDNKSPAIKEEDEFDMKKVIYTGDISKLSFIPVSTNNKITFAVAETPFKEMVYAALDEVSFEQDAEPAKPLQHPISMLCAFAALTGANLKVKALFVSENSIAKIMTEILPK